MCDTSADFDEIHNQMKLTLNSLNDRNMSHSEILNHGLNKLIKKPTTVTRVCL